MIWFTSDTHFSHRRVIDYGKRPYANVEQMNEALIENWNSCVKKNEHIYVLGDFSFAGKDYTRHVLSRLNGFKILCKGNHDRDNEVMLDLGFNKVLENEKIKIGHTEVFISHYPYHPIQQHNTWNGKVMLHKMDENVDNRYLHKRILDDGKTWLLHGHVHTSWKIKDRMINVGVDQWNWRPVGHERLLEIINGGRRD